MSTPRRKSKSDSQEWPYISFSAPENAWKVDARTKTGGPRKFFKTKAAAETYASQCRAARINEGVSAFGHAELTLRGKTVQQAIDFYLNHLRTLEKSISVSSALEELISAKESAGRTKRYTQDLRSRLTKFQEGFRDATIASITAREIDTWLAALPLAPGTRNTFRRDIRTLFSFCERRRYCPGNEAAKTEMAKDVDKPTSILTPGEATELLSKCGDDLIPYVAIALFAGLRTAELRKLDWAEVDLDGGHIEVTAAKAKTARRRLVPIAENLRTWIKSLAEKSGPVTPNNLWRRFRKVKTAAGFKKWDNNVMRHSYGSYRLAQCHDAAKVSLEMGNSPQIVFAHYRELVKPGAAEAYWSITKTRKRKSKAKSEAGT